MKAILLSLTLFLLVMSDIINLNTSCPEQSIADLNKICITPTFIEGCLIYQSTNHCHLCSSSYKLLNGKCSITDQSTVIINTQVGCLQISNRNCINCANGFIRTNGTCQVGIPNCQFYNPDNTCKQCKIDHSLILNQCKHNHLLGCRMEEHDHSCSQCFPPFQLKYRQCVIEYCLAYNDFGCHACECDYFVTEQGTCQKMQGGCLKYTRGVCSYCKAGYSLKEGSCTIEGCLSYQYQQCFNCSANYDLINGLCVFKNCEDWQNDSCRICSKGFNLFDGKCLPYKDQFICSC